MPRLRRLPAAHESVSATFLARAIRYASTAHIEATCQAGHPGEDEHRGGIEVGAFRAPRVDDAIDLVLVGRFHGPKILDVETNAWVCREWAAGVSAMPTNRDGSVYQYLRNAESTST